jgi:hypothetical protein
MSSSVRSLSWSFFVGIWWTSTRVHGMSRDTITFGWLGARALARRCLFSSALVSEESSVNVTM